MPSSVLSRHLTNVEAGEWLVCLCKLPSAVEGYLYLSFFYWKRDFFTHQYILIFYLFRRCNRPLLCWLFKSLNPTNIFASKVENINIECSNVDACILSEQKTSLKGSSCYKLLIKLKAMKWTLSSHFEGKHTAITCIFNPPCLEEKYTTNYSN